MKVKITDLNPNPFRDMKNYPIDEAKVESLINSINETGFWDNILARKQNGQIQIAYGHHRMIALQRLFKPEDTVDIPVKDVSDSAMVQIMANENHQSWGTLPRVTNETVKVTKQYLESHPEIVTNLSSVEERFRSKNYPVGAKVISEFLGKNWKTTRIQHSLEQLGLMETDETHEKHLDKKAINALPTERSARNFTRAVKQIKNITPQQQRRAAEKMVSGTHNLGESAAKKTLLEEKHSFKKDKTEKKQIEFSDFIDECRKDMDKLNRKFAELLKFKAEFNSEIYEKSLEKWGFNIEVKIMITNLQNLTGGKYGHLPRNI